MSIICPAILAENAHNYREQFERVQGFAKRIQIDLANDTLAPGNLVKPIQLYWNDDIEADIHVMIKNPREYFETLVSLKPNMIIIHAEAEGDLTELMSELRAMNIKAGIAILQDTQVADCTDLIKDADHVLIFSGNFGQFGGEANLSLLKKVHEVKEINPDAEIGWDGGVNKNNAKALADGGVDVLSSGGAIQKAEDPEAAYQEMVDAIS